eukprot:3697457-Rhodomonas_salina.1
MGWGFAPLVKAPLHFVSFGERWEGGMRERKEELGSLILTLEAKNLTFRERIWKRQSCKSISEERIERREGRVAFDGNCFIITIC